MLSTGKAVPPGVFDGLGSELNNEPLLSLSSGAGQERPASAGSVAQERFPAGWMPMYRSSSCPLPGESSTSAVLAVWEEGDGRSSNGAARQGSNPNVVLGLGERILNLAAGSQGGGRAARHGDQAVADCVLGFVELHLQLMPHCRNV
eukprot:CAMPEP_0204202548 /NCGR_PEP_ID=MMETSP0361-20130328/68301_1 /ASSEMBLY_ACC=CAM_ASM_000343 /TAXON_ID=268821 /ORGANISM="Scrippsiella Hangoei, Strain SHTV-5" /LENGTH=146 /DNA_ID=CAMNT_0051165379 /DNA_START=101 /DNA_END=542 /DNA_ORIENTATION=+